MTYERLIMHVMVIIGSINSSPQECHIYASDYQVSMALVQIMACRLLGAAPL